MEVLEFIGSVIKGHPPAPRAVIVVVVQPVLRLQGRSTGIRRGILEGETTGLALGGVGLRIRSTGQESQRRRFSKNSGIDLERRRSAGVLREEIHVGIALIIPQFRDLRGALVTGLGQ